MKRLLIIAALCASLGAFAQSKINGASVNPADTVEATIEFAGQPDFGGVDVDVASSLGSLAVVRATGEQLQRLAALPQVVQISVSQPVRLLSDPDPAVETKSDAVQTEKKSGGFFGWLRRLFNRES